MNQINVAYNYTMKLLHRKLYNLSPLYNLRRNAFFIKTIMPLLDIPVSTQVYGLNWKVRVRLISNLSWILSSRSLNPGLAPLFLAINQVLQPRSFWDVGANIGFFSWLLMSHNNNLQVALFEPDPENAKLIRETIAQSNLKNVQLFDTAVSDEVGEAQFAIDSITSATGSLEVSNQNPAFIKRHYGVNPEFKIVKTVTLNYMLEQGKISPPDFIKIDVEGAEKKVIDGANELIKTYRPVLIFECFFPEKLEVVNQLINLEYRVINAENPKGAIDGSMNLLAIPNRYEQVYEQLIKTWHREIDRW